MGSRVRVPYAPLNKINAPIDKWLSHHLFTVESQVRILVGVPKDFFINDLNDWEKERYWDDEDNEKVINFLKRAKRL